MLKTRGDVLLYIVVILAALAIGTIVSLINGSWPDFSNIKFEKAWLLFPAEVLQIISSLTESRGYRFGTITTVMVNGAVFVFVFLVIWFNRKYAGLWLIGIGALLNALVMMFNGGRMPVDISSLSTKAYMADALELIMKGADNKHVAINSATKLPALADIYSVPGFLGLGMPLISIGDIIIAAGLFLLCLQFMLKSRKAKTVY